MQPRLLFSLLCSSSAAFLLALAPLLLGNAIFVVAALGGPLNPPYYIAERAVNALNNASEDLLHWKLEMLESATAPVLREGRLRQQMKFVIVRTKCLKLEDQSRVLLDLCPVDEDAPRMECTIEVLTDQHGHQQFSNSKCQRFVRLRSEKAAERKDIKKQSAAAPAEPVVDRQRPMEIENAVDGVPKTENGDGTWASANAVGDGTQKDLLTTKQLMSAIEHTLKLKDLEIWAKFRQFVSRFGKAYASKREVLKRFRVYRRNLGLARKWQDVEQGSAVYGETQFMDMSMLEFKRIFLPYQWPLHVPGTTFAPPINDDDNSLPTEWDWRQHGAVTAVKNQGMCGSCWAFSVTGNIEGQWALKRDGGGRLEALSEQELLDCDKVDMACDGGLPLQAYKEIIRIGGLEPERDYPYDAHREQCHLNRSDIAAYINGSVQLAQDEVQMAKWLVKNGPISVGVNAMPLQFYRHGISHPWRLFCSPHMLNHGVLIVGFGQEGDKPFWIIKNSWGAHWGEEGYYRLYRGKNVCGIHEMATSAVIQ